MSKKPLLEQVVSAVRKHSQSGTIKIQPIRGTQQPSLAELEERLVEARVAAIESILNHSEAETSNSASLEEYSQFNIFNSDQEEEEKEEMAANDRLALEDLGQPIIPNSPSCILLSTEARNYELKSSHFQMLPSFYGLPNEDPLAHIKEFYTVVCTLPLKDVSEADLRMRVFPYTLKDRAKTWLMSLTPGSLTSWDAVAKKFLEKFFSSQKTATLRSRIFNYAQHDGEPFNECWERFKGTLMQCPHHGLPLYLQMQIFYDGLTETCQSTVNNAAVASI